MPNFGELLRRLRGTRQQKDVAFELGMPVTTLSTLENQDSLPRGPVLKKFSDYYCVPVTYFYSSPAQGPRSTDNAKAWLESLKSKPVAKDAIATYAPPEYPDEIKKRFAEKIRQKKHAKTQDSG